MKAVGCFLLLAFLGSVTQGSADIDGPTATTAFKPYDHFLRHPRDSTENESGLVVQQQRKLELDEECFAGLKSLFPSKEVCAPVAGSPAEGFITFMTEELIPALKTLDGILDPKVQVPIGPCGDIGISITESISKLVEILESKANPCYGAGERGSGKFSLKRSRSNEKVLDRLDDILKKMQRIPVVKTYVRPIRKAISAFTTPFRQVAKRISGSDGCARLMKTLDVVSDRLDNLGDIQEAVSLSLQFSQRMTNFACLLQGSLDTVTDRRVLHRMLKIRSHRLRRHLLAHAGNVTATAPHHQARFLAFVGDEVVDTALLQPIPDTARVLSQIVLEVNQVIGDGTQLLQGAFNTLDDILVPVVAFGDVTDTILSPIVSVFGEIVEALAFLRCPSWLGFLCDLDFLIIQIINNILGLIGLNPDVIIADLGRRLAEALGLPSIADIDPLFEPFSFDLLEPTREALGNIADGFSVDPFEDAFDQSGNKDFIFPNGLEVEFRYTSSGNSILNFVCPEGQGRFPITLIASSVSPCFPWYRFTDEILYPCGKCENESDPTCVSRCDIDVSPQIPICEEATSPLNFLGVSFNYNTALYMCLTAGELASISIPSLEEDDFTAGDQLVPGGQMTFDCSYLPDHVVSFRGVDTFEYFSQEFASGISELNPLQYYERTTTMELECENQYKTLENFIIEADNACNGNFPSCSHPVSERCFCVDEECTKIDFRHYFLRGRYSCRPKDESSTDGLPVKTVHGMEICGFSEPSPSPFDEGSASPSPSPLDDSVFPPVVISTVANSMMVKETVETYAIDEITWERGALVSKEENIVPMGDYRDSPGLSLVADRTVFTCPAGRSVNVLEAKVGRPGTVVGFGSAPVAQYVTDQYRAACFGLYSCSTGRLDCPSNYVGLWMEALEYECVCENGFALLPDGGECTPCGVGRYRGFELPEGVVPMDECQNCPIGTFNGAEASGSCEPCGEGTYIGTTGQASCTPCPAGTSLNVTGSTSLEDCVPCEQHSSSEPGSSTCEACPAGHKTITTGSPECIPVDPGEFNDGVNGPKNCAPGSYSTFPGSTECDLCPRGTYGRFEGQAGCASENCTSTHTGACLPCKPGTYQDGTGQSDCKPCSEPNRFISGATSGQNCSVAPLNINYNSPEYKDLSLDDLFRLDLDADTTVSETEREEILGRRHLQIGNGICNFGPWNTKQGNYDGGDCCRQSCVIPNITSVEEDDDLSFNSTDEDDDQFLTEACLDDMFGECRDPEYLHIPDVACIDDLFERRLSWTRNLAELGDGFCDAEFNNEANSFDSGDCCLATCKVNRRFPWESCTGFSSCDQPSGTDLAKGFIDQAFDKALSAVDDCLDNLDCYKRKAERELSALEKELNTLELVCPESFTKGTDAGSCVASVPRTDYDTRLGSFCLLSLYKFKNPPAKLERGTSTLQYEANFGIEFPSIPLLGTDLNGLLNTRFESPTCEFQITIEDQERPTIVCPKDLRTCEATPPGDRPVVSDNCDSDLEAIPTAAVTTLEVGTNALEFTATDSSGNIASCVWNIFLEAEDSCFCTGTPCSPTASPSTKAPTDTIVPPTASPSTKAPTDAIVPPTASPSTKAPTDSIVPPTASPSTKAPTDAIIPPTASPSTEAPTEEPAESIFSLCFSDRGTIQVQGKGVTKMAALEIGDSVLTSDGTYSKVYSFGHHAPNQTTKFLQLHGSNLREGPLEITADHLLYVMQREAQKTSLLPASEAKVGDSLITPDGPVQIGSIRLVERRGAYAPLTESGDLLVNGVAASNYVTRDWLPWSGDVLRALQHRGMTPVRLYCHWFVCQEETYDAETGFSPWVQFWFDVEQWQLGLRPAGRTAFWLVFSVVAAVLWCIDWLLSLSSSALFHAVAATFGYWVWKSAAVGRTGSAVAVKKAGPKQGVDLWNQERLLR